MPKKMLNGKTQDVINANIQMLKDGGYSHSRATRCALCHANKKHDKDTKRIASKAVKNSKQVIIKG